MRFFLTFGQQSPARNGWVEVRAPDYEQAKAMVEGIYGNNWSNLYEEKHFDKIFYPAGKLGEIGVGSE